MFLGHRTSSESILNRRGGAVGESLRSETSFLLNQLAPVQRESHENGATLESLRNIFKGFKNITF